MKKTFIRIAWALAFALPALTFTACNDDDPEPIVLSDEADILTVEFKDQTVIQSGPTRDGEATPTRFVFYVRHDADDDIKALVPTIEISEGATISPKSGVPQDFNAKSSIRYTVTAEDGVTKVPYDIVCERIASDDAWVTKVRIEEEELVSIQPGEVGKDVSSATFTLKPGVNKSSLTPIIEVIEGATIDPESGVPQDFTDGSVEYTVTALDRVKTFKFTLNCEQELFTGATIDKLIFNSDIVTTQPQLGNTNTLIIEVSGAATEDDIAALSFDTFVISEGAVATIKSGDIEEPLLQGHTPGFVIGEPIIVTVTPEDGPANVYEIICQHKCIYYDFEDWYDKDKYTMVRPWWNANEGVSTAITMGLGVPYPTAKTTDTPSEAGSAVELKTYKGEIKYLLPTALVAGNLYLGGFYLTTIQGMSNPLVGTKFGIPFYEEPIKVTGMFKYSPGDSNDFWEKKTHKPGNYDSYAMTAILYEVNDYGTFENGEYQFSGSGSSLKYECGEDIFTGVELSGDIRSNERVVAIAQKDETTAYPDFTPFELVLEYLKEYDPTKKYKFSIIFSSSKEGAQYRGANGSTLIVDDVYVILK